MTLKNALARIEAQLKRKIPPVLFIVIIQNGILETILRLFVRDSIEIIVVSQKMYESILYRKICVKMKPDGVVIMHAESKIETKSLPTDLRERVIEGKKGIGDLIETLRIETYRHIRDIQFDRKQRAICRTYDIYIQSRPVITIKEYFPIDLPIWNLR